MASKLHCDNCDSVIDVADGIHDKVVVLTNHAHKSLQGKRVQLEVNFRHPAGYRGSDDSSTRTDLCTVCRAEALEKLLGMVKPLDPTTLVGGM